MMKPSIRILLAIMLLTAIMLGACDTVTITDLEQATAQFKTAVAGTVTAQVPTDTPSPQFTQTFIPSETAVPTITETPSLSPIPPTIMDTYCDNSAFVADVTIPDHTILAPGQAFEKTWTFKNTGTCTWKPGYTITIANGDIMRGSAAKAIGQSVAPQEEINVTVKLFAPNKPGDYIGGWRLANGRKQPFGAFVWVEITVAASGTMVPTLESNTPVVTLTPTP